MAEDASIYIFQLLGTQELHEIKAKDSAEAFQRCLQEKAWPIEKVAYLGKKERP